MKLLMDLSGEQVYYGDLQHIDKGTRGLRSSATALPAGVDRHAAPVTFAEHGIPTEGRGGGLFIQLTCQPGEGVLAAWAATAANSNWPSPPHRRGAGRC